MRCPNCQAEIQDHAKFCPECEEQILSNTKPFALKNGRTPEEYGNEDDTENEELEDIEDNAVSENSIANEDDEDETISEDDSEDEAKKIEKEKMLAIAAVLKAQSGYSSLEKKAIWFFIPSALVALIALCIVLAGIFLLIGIASVLLEACGLTEGQSIGIIGRLCIFGLIIGFYPLLRFLWTVLKSSFLWVYGLIFDHFCNEYIDKYENLLLAYPNSYSKDDLKLFREEYTDLLWDE